MDRIFSLGFLDVADDPEDKNDTKDYRTIYKLAQSKRETAGDEQNINERLMELQKKSFPRPACRLSPLLCWDRISLAGI